LCFGKLNFGGKKITLQKSEFYFAKEPGPFCKYADLQWNIKKSSKCRLDYTLGLVIGQALVIGQLDVFLSYYALKL
jgi:hypothetical protein